jgi:protein arginine kinase
MNWINTGGPEDAYVLSSRIRLARNFNDTPFPNRMTKEQADGVVSQVENAVQTLANPMRFIRLDDVSALDKDVLSEQQVISHELAQSEGGGALACDQAQVCGIMINEEDHLRIQAILPGLQLDEAYRLANELDDGLEKELKYAYDGQWGYLTSCPTNVGTGLRTSVMLHLPALEMTKNINGVLETATKIGLAVRGMFGEGSRLHGAIYQVSNQVSLGRSEIEVIQTVKTVAEQIIEQERKVREALQKANPLWFADRIWRGVGTLSSARIMRIKEFMLLISRMRLGAAMEILPGVDVKTVDKIMVEGQPGHIGKGISEEERAEQDGLDVARARFLREKLKDSLTLM